VRELESRLADDQAALAAARRADAASASEREARIAELESGVEEARAERRALQQQAADERQRLASRLEALAEELETARAGAAARDLELQAAVDDRDLLIGRLRVDLDRARAEHAEVAGLEARVRTLNRKLAESAAEIGRTQTALDAVAEREVQAVALAAAAADITAERDRLDKTVKRLEGELREERARASALSRSLERVERNWRARLSELEGELKDARRRADASGTRRIARRTTSTTRSDPPTS
jgi:chromosome segregation ATPase